MTQKKLHALRMFGDPHSELNIQRGLRFLRETLTIWTPETPARFLNVGRFEPNVAAGCEEGLVRIAEKP